MNRPSPTVEDYLGAIYTLRRDNQTVICHKLVDWFAVSPPTVTATVQRMVRDGWITMAEDKTIHLTPKGTEAAASVVKRHMLTELLLAKVLGVPWSKVHEEADELEHHVSPETAARVAEIVGQHHVCPHGNPLPGYEQEALIPLLRAEPGRKYYLARIHEELEINHELTAYLEEHHLIPGVTIILIQVIPSNEIVTVQIGDKQVVLGLSVARKLWLCEKDACIAHI